MHGRVQALRWPDSLMVQVARSHDPAPSHRHQRRLRAHGARPGRALSRRSPAARAACGHRCRLRAGRATRCSSRPRRNPCVTATAGRGPASSMSVIDFSTPDGLAAALDFCLEPGRAPGGGHHRLRCRAEGPPGRGRRAYRRAAVGQLQPRRGRAAAPAARCRPCAARLGRGDHRGPPRAQGGRSLRYRHCPGRGRRAGPRTAAWTNMAVYAREGQPGPRKQGRDRLFGGPRRRHRRRTHGHPGRQGRAPGTDRTAPPTAASSRAGAIWRRRCGWPTSRPGHYDIADMLEGRLQARPPEPRVFSRGARRCGRGRRRPCGPACRTVS